jgi:N-acetylglutamate synthase/N-acetylornithine aminotransferase
MYAVTADALGVDPLLDKVVPSIQSIVSHSMHDVTADERGAPDLISLNVYGATDYWWIILAYNGIGSYRLITEGITLKIPDLGSVIAAVGQNALRPNKISRVITI